MIAEVDGKEVLVSFYESFWKGIYDISFWIDGKERKVEIKNSYPGFIQRIREAWMLVRLHLQYAVDAISKRNS